MGGGVIGEPAGVGEQGPEKWGDLTVQAFQPPLKLDLAGAALQQESWRQRPGSTWPQHLQSRVSSFSQLDGETEAQSISPGCPGHAASETGRQQLDPGSVTPEFSLSSLP